MSRFDAELWRARSWSRYQRSQAKRPDKAMSRLARDVWAIAAIQLVDAWCAKEGLDVVFNQVPNALYDNDVRRIYVNANASPESQVYLMLHECGHHLIKSKSDCGCQKRTYRSSKVDVKEARHQFKLRCQVLDEEFEAWHLGWALAQHLELKVDRNRFDALKTTSLKTYMKWAINTKGYA